MFYKLYYFPKILAICLFYCIFTISIIIIADLIQIIWFLIENY